MLMPWHPSLDTGPTPEEEELEALVAEHESLFEPEVSPVGVAEVSTEPPEDRRF